MLSDIRRVFAMMHSEGQKLNNHTYKQLSTAIEYFKQPQQTTTVRKHTRSNYNRLPQYILR